MQQISLYGCQLKNISDENSNEASPPFIYWAGLCSIL
jgi:hypothetical protein